jgi:hypothetical protein
MQWGDLEGLGACIFDAMSRAFHVALCCGATWVEIPENKFFRHIWAPFEEPLLCGFQKSGDFGIAQGLVCKFDSVDLHSHQVCKRSDVDSWLDVGINLKGLWSTTYTGAGLSKLREVHNLALGMGSVQKSVD